VIIFAIDCPGPIHLLLLSELWCYVVRSAPSSDHTPDGGAVPRNGGRSRFRPKGPVMGADVVWRFVQNMFSELLDVI